MNRSSLYWFALLLMASCMAGCIGPRPSVMPEAAIQCLVVDARSKEPVQGAALFMVYDGPKSQKVKRGPFLTDKNGQGLIRVAKETLWVTWSEAYFVGGYTRLVQVSASGFEGATAHEDPTRGSFGRSTLRFELQPFRNRFGAVEVKSQTETSRAIELQLQVLDGPHKGESILLPVEAKWPRVNYVGKRLYLRESLESISEREKRYSIIAHNPSQVLREGFPDEPFTPE